MSSRYGASEIARLISLLAFINLVRGEDLDEAIKLINRAIWCERDRAVDKLDRLVEVLAPNQVDEREQFVGIREVGIELAREPERRAHLFDGLFGKIGYILALVDLLAVDGEGVVIVRQVILRTGFDRPPEVAPRLGITVLPQPERSERLMRQRQTRIER